MSSKYKYNVMLALDCLYCGDTRAAAELLLKEIGWNGTVESFAEGEEIKRRAYQCKRIHPHKLFLERKQHCRTWK